MLTETKIPTMAELINGLGSQRRLFLEYWLGHLSAEAEVVIEDSVAPEKLIGYRPIA